MKSRQASAASTSTSAVAAASRARVRRLARTQQRLGRDAGPVGALAADELALDDGDAQAALRERAGAVLARRAAAEHDHVVVAHVRQLGARLLRDHVRRIPVRPVLVRTPVRFSCSPWAASARRIAFARSQSEANVSPAHRSGRAAGVVISCSSQPLPSGSLNDANGAVAGAVGRRAADATLVAVGLELRPRRLGVEGLADVDAAGDELVARSVDVGDDE